MSDFPGSSTGVICGKVQNSLPLEKPDDSPGNNFTDNVVALTSYARQGPQIASPGSAGTRADVLPFQKTGEFLASVEIDRLTMLTTEHHATGVQSIIDQVKKLLRSEFGAAAVRREAQHFSLAHDDFEQLVAGVLRVQFYSNCIELPRFNIFGEVTDQCGVTLTWGAGRTADEATSDRKKKKRMKELRRHRRG